MIFEYSFSYLYIQKTVVLKNDKYLKHIIFCSSAIETVSADAPGWEEQAAEGDWKHSAGCLEELGRSRH